MSQLRIASYNVHRAIGRDRRTNQQRTIQARIATAKIEICTGL